jgi:hypothetical protein
MGKKAGGLDEYGRGVTHQSTFDLRPEIPADGIYLYYQTESNQESIFQRRQHCLFLIINEFEATHSSIKCEKRVSWSLQRTVVKTRPMSFDCAWKCLVGRRVCSTKIQHGKELRNLT